MTKWLFPYKELDILFEKNEAIEIRKYIIIGNGRMFPKYIDKIKNNKNLYNIPYQLFLLIKKQT